MIEISAIYWWYDQRLFFYNLNENTKRLLPEKDSISYWQPSITLKGVIDIHSNHLSPAFKTGTIHVESTGKGKIVNVDSIESKFCKSNIVD